MKIKFNPVDFAIIFFHFLQSHIHHKKTTKNIIQIKQKFLKSFETKKIKGHDRICCSH